MDMESGLTEYASNCVRRWDGLYVRADQYETRHPQEFVKALNDPAPLTMVSPYPDSAVPQDLVPSVVGNTTVPTKTSPAAHLFQPGIGDMTIGVNFQVY